MKVKELIDYLYKCDMGLEIFYGVDIPIESVIEHKSITDPADSFVELS